jgi:hypothetical protein
VDRRAEVGQRNPVNLIQGDFDGRTLRQGLEILKNALDQVVMFSPAAAANVRNYHPVVFQN